MKKTITLNTFRKLARAEDAMMRSCMPRISAVDVAPLISPIITQEVRRTWRAGSLITKTGFTMQEVARAN